MRTKNKLLAADIQSLVSEAVNLEFAISLCQKSLQSILELLEKKELHFEEFCPEVTEKIIKAILNIESEYRIKIIEIDLEIARQERNIFREIDFADGAKINQSSGVIL